METEPSNPLKEIFDELFGLLESLEAQSMALTQFLKDQKIGNDKKLAPYLEQAGNASSVKWRAARARMEYLLAPMQKEADDKKKEAEKKESEMREPEKNESEKYERATAQQPAEKAATQGADQAGKAAADADPNAKPAKKADSGPAKPETEEKTKPETERK
jgi:hypothetical protein